MSKYRKGFTLVELSFSLVFISILSLAVVIVVANAISAYHKSLTLGMVDETGMSIVDDMKASVQASPTSSIVGKCEYIYESNSKKCTDDGGKGLVSVVKTAELTIDGVKQPNVPIYGAFCTGTYSYIWNSGYLFNDAVSESKGRASFEYLDVNGRDANRKDFRLLKVKDKDRAVCVAAVRTNGNGTVKTDGYDTNNINGGSPIFNLKKKGLIKANENVVIEEEPVELLGGSGTGGLAIYDLAVTFTEQSGATKNIFYAPSFILGTIDGGENIMTTENNCQPPNDDSGMSGSFDYCAINKFNFAAMANGGNI